MECGRIGIWNEGNTGNRSGIRGIRVGMRGMQEIKLEMEVGMTVIRVGM